MKLLRHGPPGQERPGLLDQQGHIRDLSAWCGPAGDDLLANGLWDRLHAQPAGFAASLPRVEPGVRLGCPVARVGKIVCVGLNYADHCREAGMAVPTEPVLFLKATSSIGGPCDDVVIPRGSRKTDWEVELGVVMGQRASYVAPEDALAHVAGYCVVNDISEREYQLERGGQWDKGKSCDTFSPIGPWLVSRDEVPDPQNLSLWLDVNGRRYQTGYTGTMVFGVAQLVSYISQFMTLWPGDIISTGTPPGVGMGHKPDAVYLNAGDVMTLGIAGLGEQRQRCVAWAPR